MQLVVESRRLTNAIVEETYHGAVASGIAFDDGGATLHVLGTDDGLEHLRFDCFENEPHYHYIDQAAVGNTVVRIDELAVGDPIEFSLACVEHHLPDMLRQLRRRQRSPTRLPASSTRCTPHSSPSAS